MDRKRILHIARLIFKVCFTVLLVWLVFRKVKFKEIESIFFKSDPAFIFLAFALLFLSQVVSSWRLQGFLKAGGMPVSFAFNIRLYFLGLFYNSFLPGGVGGDAYKIYLLKKRYGLGSRKILIPVALDRISGLFAICLLTVFFWFILQTGYPPRYLLIFMATTGVVLYYLLVRYFFASYISYLPAAIGKAVMVQSLQVLCIVMLLRAQHLNEDSIPYLFSFLVSSVAAVIPVSVGGAGVREYVMLTIAGPLHMNVNTAVFTAIFFYFLSLLMALPGMYFAWKGDKWATNTAA